jgi:hypothetical protein
MTIARKLARRCFHSMRELGPVALEPPTKSFTVPIASAQAHKSQMRPSRPAGSQKCCDTRPPAAVPKRPSGRSRSPRIDRSTITSPASRPRTQIRPGARGTTAPTATAEPHNHSPPTLTTAPVQIGSTHGARSCLSLLSIQAAGARARLGRRRPDAHPTRARGRAAIMSRRSWAPPRASLGRRLERATVHLLSLLAVRPRGSASSSMGRTRARCALGSVFRLS